jgi:hypothetical protein
LVIRGELRTVNTARGSGSRAVEKGGALLAAAGDGITLTSFCFLASAPSLSSPSIPNFVAPPGTGGVVDVVVSTRAEVATTSCAPFWWVCSLCGL